MTNTPAEDAIRRVYARWFRAMESADVDGLLSLLGDPFMLKMPGQPPLTDRDALRRGLEEFHAAFSEEVEHEVQALGVAGDWAWAQVHERAVLTPRAGGSPRELSGTHLAVLVRGPDGAWRIHRDVSSFDGEP